MAKAMALPATVVKEIFRTTGNKAILRTQPHIVAHIKASSDSLPEAEIRWSMVMV